MTAKDIKALRADLDVTQGELATIIGVSLSTVQRWERGSVTPTLYENGMLEQIRLKKHPRRFRVAVLLVRYGPVRALASLL